MMFAVFLVITALAATELYADPSCPKVDGPDSVYFPHDDCTKFWQCSNGVPYLFNCSANLHFNPTLNVCDWPDQAGCEGGSVNDSESGESGSGGSDGSGENGSGGSDGSGSEEEPEPVEPVDPVEPEEPSNETDDSSDSSSDSNSSESGECPAVDGDTPVYIPDEDCTKFWQCSNGVAYQQDCPANLHFNPELNVCDWPEQAGCAGSGSSGSGSEEEPEPVEPVDPVEPEEPSNETDDTSDSSDSNSSESGECPAVDGDTPVYIPDEDCSKFWQCSNGVAYQQDCPANLHFNPELNVCDWPEQAGCAGSGSSGSGSEEEPEPVEPVDPVEPEEPSNETDDTSDSSDSNSSESGECPAVDGDTPVYIPDEDCTKFWQCSNGVAYQQDCPANLHFNPELNVCDWPEQAGCAGSGSSGSGSEEEPEPVEPVDPVEPEEPSNETDDTSDSSDSSSDSNSSESRECPAKDGENSVYIPDEDCTKFWQCSNGVAYQQNCPANLHFNPELNVCDWPEQAGCKGSGSSSSSSESNSGEEGNSGENGNNSGGDDDGNNSSGSGGDGSGEDGGKCPAQDGPDSVYIPHPDCTKFWQCSNGTPYLFDCPANLHFNPTLNVCDWPDQAGCNGAGDSNES